MAIQMSFGGYYELSSKVKKALPNFGPTEPKAILSFKVCAIQKTTNLPHDPCAQHCILFQHISTTSVGARNYPQINMFVSTKSWLLMAQVMPTFINISTCLILIPYGGRLLWFWISCILGSRCAGRFLWWVHPRCTIPNFLVLPSGTRMNPYFIYYLVI